MKRFVAVAVVAFLSGCSNAPIAGMMDWCFPSKAPGKSVPDRAPIPPGDRIPPADLGAPVGPPRP